MITYISIALESTDDNPVNSGVAIETQESIIETLQFFDKLNRNALIESAIIFNEIFCAAHDCRDSNVRITSLYFSAKHCVV